MPENCFPCNTDPCQEIVTPKCETKLKNCCEDSFPANCIFITEKLLCTNGLYYIAADTNVQEAIKQLICRTNELENKINYILQTCCTSLSCDIVDIINVVEVN